MHGFLGMASKISWQPPAQHVSGHDSRTVVFTALLSEYIGKATP